MNFQKGGMVFKKFLNFCGCEGSRTHDPTDMSRLLLPTELRSQREVYVIY